MRYAIIGAGGIGSATGALLDIAGVEATIVARPAHVKKVSTDGLTLIDAEGNQSTGHPRAVSSVSDVDWPDIDVAFLTTKSYDTVSVLESLVRIDSPMPPIACVQNGVTNEDWVARFGFRPIGAVARFQARLLEPGRVLTPGRRSISLGRWGNLTSDETLAGIAAELSSAGIESEVATDIMSDKWSKLIMNTVNAVYALTEAQISDIRHDRHLVAAINLIWTESRDILMEAGILFDAVNDLEVPSIDATPPPASRLEYHGSTWDDAVRGKTRNEVPWLNGEIVRLAALHDLEAPLNSYIVHHASLLARGKVATGHMTPESLANDLAACLGES